MADTSASSPLDTSAPSLDPNAGTPDGGTQPPQQGGSQPTEYWGKGWVKDDGTFDHSRWDKAPDDLKPLKEELGRFKALDELLKSNKELRTLASKKGIAEPLAKDATPEQRAEHMSLVRRALGAPDKPEGYVIEKPKDLPDTHWDAKAVTDAAKIAFDEGVSPAALQKLVEYETQRGIASAKAQELAVKAMWDGQDAMIRTAVAKEGMDFATAKGLAEKAGQRWGVEKDSPLMQNATVFMLLTRLGKAGGEAPLVQGDTGDDALRAHTPESAQKALDAIRDDNKNPKWFAYWNKDPENPKKDKPHPDHDKVVSECKRLSALANANRQMRPTQMKS